MLLIDEIQSPLGRIAIAARDGRLCALEFGRARLARQLAARYPDVPRRRARDPFGLSAKLRAYLAGDLAAVDRIPSRREAPRSSSASGARCGGSRRAAP